MNYKIKKESKFFYPLSLEFEETLRVVGMEEREENHDKLYVITYGPFFI